MIRVLVAEDSLTVRELLVGILESDPEIRVVGQAKNGAEAVDMAVRLKPDLVTMDVHMPVLDGFAATKEIMVRAPTPILVVSSSVSGRDVELSLHALRAGALMVVPKPDDPGSERFDLQRAELVTMAKAMARVKVVRRWPQPLPAELPRAPVPSGATPLIRLVAVAASTGGPAALHRILTSLPRDFAVPILVVQHIAAGFVSGLADWLSAGCNLRVQVARGSDTLQQRTVYLAPDERQMGVGPDGKVQLAATPAVNGFRPSASYLFSSVAQVYGGSAVAVILTGMGNDGVEGLRAVRAAGGRVLAQDEASSIVYGMPGEAFAAGVVDAVLPLDEIAPHLAALVAGGRSPGRLLKEP